MLDQSVGGCVERDDVAERTSGLESASSDR
jgi:hypothetical protein